jgi:hypothetical protein
MVLIKVRGYYAAPFFHPRRVLRRLQVQARAEVAPAAAGLRPEAAAVTAEAVAPLLQEVVAEMAADAGLPRLMAAVAVLPVAVAVATPAAEAEEEAQRLLLRPHRHHPR